MIFLGALLIAAFWPLFAELFNEDADNEAIAYLTMGAIPVLLGTIFLCAGIATILRQRSNNGG